MSMSSIIQSTLNTNSSNLSTKPIAYTLGEPAGIGVDIFVQLAQQYDLSDLVVVGDQNLIDHRAKLLGLEFPPNVQIEHIPLADSEVAGVASVDNVAGVMSSLNRAIDGCVSGEFAALVTGPLHKGIINDAGISFSGHTEYLAQRCSAKLPIMMLATESLRVALITTHLPLKEVSAAITEAAIMDTCEIIHQDLRAKFGVENPRLIVCGLNPHAGEGGHLGMEEIDIIIPALEKLKTKGVDVLGPLPADTLFTPKYLDKADVVVAMYHDQGLPVLKSHGFKQAVNITLGLPIIRTSVDHGTAFDLAGSGLANTGSLYAAIEVARQMVEAERPGAKK